MLVQLLGAVLILTAFVLGQAGRLHAGSIAYLAINLVGSAMLTCDALLGREWGFVLLELVWALVSAWGLVKRLTAERPAAA